MFLWNSPFWKVLPVIRFNIFFQLSSLIMWRCFLLKNVGKLGLCVRWTLFIYLDRKRIENVFYILDLSTFARRSNNNSVQVFDQKMLIKQLKPVLIKIVFHEHLCAHWFLIFFFHFYRFRLLGKRLSFFRRGVFLFLLFFRWSWLFAYAIPTRFFTEI
jgi:hypothetical protein